MNHPPAFVELAQAESDSSLEEDVIERPTSRSSHHSDERQRTHIQSLLTLELEPYPMGKRLSLMAGYPPRRGDAVASPAPESSSKNRRRRGDRSPKGGNERP